MPDVIIGGFGGTRHAMRLSVAGSYKPGDMPPEGYNDWHEWARIQYKAGLRQNPCCRCGKHKFPQEMSHSETVERRANKNGRGPGVLCVEWTCIGCNGGSRRCL